MTSNTNYYKPV